MTDLASSPQGWVGRRKSNGIPQLSADGRTVALLGNPTEATNVFLVDMRAGLSRQAVRQLTREIVSIPPIPLGASTCTPMFR